MKTNCTQCGGAVALTLAGPEPTCGLRGAADPLPPPTRARLDEVRARVGHRRGRQRHLTGTFVSAAGSATSGGIVLLVTMWMIFGGMAVGLGVFGHDMALIPFLLGPPPEAALAGEWWLILALAIGFPLSLGLWGFALFRLRGLQVQALPASSCTPRGSSALSMLRVAPARGGRTASVYVLRYGFTRTR